MSMVPTNFFRCPPSNMHDPFHNLNMFDHFKNFPFAPHHPPFPNEISPMMSAQIEWKETPEAHELKAHLPGFNKEEVKVEVEDGRVLHITCERKISKEDKTEKEHRMVRGSGHFFRCFKLPENSKTDKMKASMDNGVLIVVVPKEHLSRNSNRRIITLD